MVTILDGEGVPSSPRCAVVAARFNADVTEALLEGCLHALRAAGIREDALTVARVPGAFELPLACERLAATNDYDVVIALGCVIRGDTPHFDYVAGTSAQGVMDASLKHGVPIIFGVLTTDTLEQAQWRADRELLASAAPDESPRDTKTTPRSNKGVEAAEAALQMVRLLEQI